MVIITFEKFLEQQETIKILEIKILNLKNEIKTLTQNNVDPNFQCGKIRCDSCNTCIPIDEFENHRNTCTST